MMSPTGPNPNSSISSECCSAVQPFQEAHISSTPNSVLKQPSVEGKLRKLNFDQLSTFSGHFENNC